MQRAVTLASTLLLLPCIANANPTTGGNQDIRWSVDGITWWVNQIALGDHDSSVFVAREGQDSGLALHTLGSEVPRFEVPEPNAVDLRVAVAERAPLAAALVSTNLGTPQDPDISAQLRTYSTHGVGTPLWAFDFPSGHDSRSGAGVAISRDGSVVVAAWPHRPSGGVLLEAFQADGTPISSALLATTNPGIQDVEIDDHGIRALLRVGLEAVVVDLASGNVETRVVYHSIYRPLTFSGDGRRFAFGYWDGNRGFLEVYERDDVGNWTSLLFREFRPNTIVSYLDLDQDGDRLGFFLQDINMEKFAVILLDVDQDHIVMRRKVEAAGTSLDLLGSAIVVSDDGSRVGAASWGDDADVTPQILTLDEAGNILTSATVEGSVRHFDLATDGSFLVFQNGGGHATQMGGNRNFLRVMGADAPELDTRGRPIDGESFELCVAGQAFPGALFLPITTELADTPVDGWQVNLSTMIHLLGPYPLDGAGWNQTFPLSLESSLDGMLLHLQAAIVRPGSAIQQTNKVSLRLGS
jgi:hypothetical protein